MLAQAHAMDSYVYKMKTEPIYREAYNVNYIV